MLIFKSNRDGLAKNLSVMLVCFFLVMLTSTVFANSNKSYNNPKSSKTKIAKGKIPATKTSQLESSSFFHALTHGKWKLAFRLRYERAAQDNALKIAKAGTLRTLFGYQTGKYAGFSGFGQLESVTRLSARTYNSGAGTSPSKTRYSIIADPSVTLLNQFYLDFDTVWNTRLRVGRQVINLDNQRFIGAVAFRQNDQTFDAASLQNTFLPGLKFFYAHINVVNRIFGPNATKNMGRQDNNTNLFNLKYSGWKYGALIGYVYSIDNRNQKSFSTSTYGLRFHGQASNGKATLLYTLEYACQNNAFNNNISYTVFYTHAGLGIKGDNLLFRADQEILSGSKNVADKAFRTPLATLHKFQGWNDVFLVTPNTGIIDSYLTLKATIKPLYHLTFTVMGHYFTSEASNSHFGNEIDAMVSKAWLKKYKLSLIYGDFYSATTPYVDTQKVWLTFATYFGS